MKSKPKWFWVGAFLVVAAQGVRAVAYHEPFGHSLEGAVQRRAITAGIEPIAWSLTGLGLILLLVWGRKVEAIPAWLLAGLVYLLSWLLIGPSSYV